MLPMIHIPSQELTQSVFFAVGGSRGGTESPPPPPPSPPQFRSTVCFLSHFVSECLTNKAQIAQDSIKPPR